MIRIFQKNLERPEKTIHLFAHQHKKYIPIDNNNFDLTDKTPIIFRGMAKSSLIKQCVDNNIDFYYIDTGYINQKLKIWHRFTKNNFQVLNHLSYEELTQRMNIKKLKDRFFEIVKKDYNSFKPEL